MDASPASSAKAFEQWSKDHLPFSNDGGQPDGATPIAIKAPQADGEPPEQIGHRPWMIPGVGGSF